MPDMRLLTTPLEKGKAPEEFSTLLECSVEYGLDSPAKSCSVVVLLEKPPLDFASFALYHNDTLCFLGVVDELRLEFREDGLLLHLFGRDRGGRLLDNQAMPETLWGANLATMFSRSIAPYGFSLNSTFAHLSLPEYTIRQGCSQWSVFSDFALQLTGYDPYVVDGVVYLRPPAPQNFVCYGGKNGTPYLSYENRKVPYEILSDIYLRDRFGSYSSFLHNPQSDYYKVQRKRYLTPWGEDSQGSKNAEVLFREAGWKAEQHKVVLCEFLLPPLCEGGEVLTPDAATKGLLLAFVKAEQKGKNTSSTLFFRRG